MRGLAGVLTSRPIHRDLMLRNLEVMAAQLCHLVARLCHRGPDDSEAWIDLGGGLALRFRRLSIMDLPPASARPWDSLAGTDLRELIGINLRQLEHMCDGFLGGRSDFASFIWALVLLAAWHSWPSGDRNAPALFPQAFRQELA